MMPDWTISRNAGRLTVGGHPPAPEVVDPRRVGKSVKQGGSYLGAVGLAILAASARPRIVRIVTNA